MNPTPSDGAAGPSPDRAAPDVEVAAADGSGGVPEPRPDVERLPRRSRGGTGGAARNQEPEPDREPGSDPDGRPLRPVDEETLNRLLSGLRDI